MPSHFSTPRTSNVPLARRKYEKTKGYREIVTKDPGRCLLSMRVGLSISPVGRVLEERGDPAHGTFQELASPPADPATERVVAVHGNVSCSLRVDRWRPPYLHISARIGWISTVKFLKISLAFYDGAYIQYLFLSSPTPWLP